MPPVAVPIENATSVLQEGSPHRSRRASLRVLTRNIGRVVLGNLAFDTWYYSPYPDNIILGPETSTTKYTPGSAADLRQATAHAHGAGQPQCERLYVCPCCFLYTPKEHDFAQHMAIHRARREQGLETQPVPESAVKVYEWEGHAVWEIDGEREKLYCQNLSLFGKLFLEQKSVFFDTSGFKYYVLTYTKLEPSVPVATKGRGRKRSSSVLEDDVLYQSQVLGFFSKENLSWDANNLACILVFPPFQHRQLGQLLMAVSYKLSGWEWEGGVIGGPEKPLSAMGRKSYLRFWSERIARFFMGQSADADAKTVFYKRKRTLHSRKEEMTVKEIGDRTGMLGEDVVAALNEMGILEVVPSKRKNRISSSEANGNTAQGEVEAEQEMASMSIHRSKVVDWAARHNVNLTSPVREEGFLGEWALSDVDESGVSDAEDADSNESLA
ncbi:uncharacterized protein PV06_04719 [Exophiala oligosperma]|uniref:histone acetyltransferase n=1 Tax=Exophiala oligosperma TaxID=215243 RepID=A0A0D2DMF6_9EURO|nr:uncharacterized protein PV06_04719 [Exophiala oligosperma]KIW43635.1 hypothetical protein PV06_04719 [Exophiala oligosperma]